MEEKKMTWKEIDTEIEKGFDRFADACRELQKQMLKVEEMIRLAPKPETLEETMMAAINKGLVNELLKISASVDGGCGSLEEGKKEAAQLLRNKLGL